MSVLTFYVLVVLPTLFIAATGATLFVVWRRLREQRAAETGIASAVDARKAEAVVRLIDRRIAS